MSYNLQSNDPGLRINTLPARTWATTGNTDVVLDSNVTSNTIVQIMNTSTFVGPWWITKQVGTGFTVNSGNSETATTTTYSYLLE